MLERRMRAKALHLPRPHDFMARIRDSASMLFDMLRPMTVVLRSSLALALTLLSTSCGASQKRAPAGPAKGAPQAQAPEAPVSEQAPFEEEEPTPSFEGLPEPEGMRPPALMATPTADPPTARLEFAWPEDLRMRMRVEFEDNFGSERTVDLLVTTTAADELLSVDASVVDTAAFLELLEDERATLLGYMFGVRPSLRVDQSGEIRWQGSLHEAGQTVREQLSPASRDRVGGLPSNANNVVVDWWAMLVGVWAGTELTLGEPRALEGNSWGMDQQATFEGWVDCGAHHTSERCVRLRIVDAYTEITLITDPQTLLPRVLHVDREREMGDHRTYVFVYR
jgi:hypothetical protein